MTFEQEQSVPIERSQCGAPAVVSWKHSSESMPLPFPLCPLLEYKMWYAQELQNSHLRPKERQVVVKRQELPFFYINKCFMIFC